MIKNSSENRYIAHLYVLYFKSETATKADQRRDPDAETDKYLTLPQGQETATGDGKIKAPGNHQVPATGGDVRKPEENGRKAGALAVVIPHSSGPYG